MLIQTVTPVEPLLQRMTHHFYCNTFVPAFVANIILHIEKIQVKNVHHCFSFTSLLRGKFVKDLNRDCCYLASKVL